MNDNKVKKSLFLKIFLGCIVGFVNGFFGGGAGMLVVPILTKIFNYEQKQGHATSLAVVFPLSVVSTVVYMMKSKTSFNVLNIGIGFVLGGIFGAMLLNKIKSDVICLIFALLTTICGIIQIINILK